MKSLQLWLKVLNLKKPPNRPYVCSYHFVDKRLTEEHPFSEKWLGYDADSTDQKATSHQDIIIYRYVPMTSQHKDADTQWEVLALTDHSYVSREPVNKPTCNEQTQCGGAEPLTHTILKNHTSSGFYTGLPISVFFDHVAFLQKFYMANLKMHITDQILITLMKLNLLQGDLAELFAVSQGVVSRILPYWIDTMEHRRMYIPWLPRETIQNTLPQCFKEKFPNTTCFIDCSETTLQKAHNIDSRGQSFSHYYSSNTLKYLVAVAPCELVILISPAYGGRCSDKFITQNSGFLEYLRPGDDVMEDTIRDLLYERKVNLAIPAFTQKGGQLSDKDVTITRRIAHMCIHVESTVPINLTHKMDHVLRICAALVNITVQDKKKHQSRVMLR
uniref:THAP-type domain-containing protein n=1 Tax=Salmo trutta TaxID=8032 RepID=A0A673ZJ57_SALTR